MSNKEKIPHAKFYVVMETFPAGKDLALRQEFCVFDNRAANYLCKHPEKIDVSEIWNALKNQAHVSGLILGQYQKEVSKRTGGKDKK